MKRSPTSWRRSFADEPRVARSLVGSRVMLYRFDPNSQRLDALVPVAAADARVLEKQIELAVANKPEAIFGAGPGGEPVLVVRTSVPGRKMPDIIALDAEGRLVLVECKRGWANRDALAQLLDYAADYATDTAAVLRRDWGHGRGRDSGKTLIEAFREFADDPGFDEEQLGTGQVLVVVASGEAPGFRKIAEYLKSRGVSIYLVTAKLFRRDNGDLYLDVEPMELAPAGELGKADGDERAWLINTDETHSRGAWQRFLESGVAAIWGYPNHGATLEKGARAGDTIYAYVNGRGIIAKGEILDSEVLNVTESTGSVFKECPDDNEWHLSVKWTPLAEGGAVSNREVREAAGAGIPVRNTFCRLWNPAVRDYLASRWPRSEV